MKEKIFLVGVLLVFIVGVAFAANASQVSDVQMRSLKPQEAFSKPKVESQIVREGMEVKIPDVPALTVVQPDPGLAVFNQKKQQDTDLDGVIDTIDTDNQTPHIYVRLRNAHCSTYPNCVEVDQDGVSSDVVLSNTGVTLRYIGHTISQGQGFPQIQVLSGNSSQIKVTNHLRYTNITGTNYVMIHLDESPEFVSLLITPFVSIPWGWLNPTLPIWPTYQYINGFLNPFFNMLQDYGFPHPPIGKEIIIIYTGPIVK